MLKKVVGGGGVVNFGSKIKKGYKKRSEWLEIVK